MLWNIYLISATLLERKTLLVNGKYNDSNQLKQNFFVSEKKFP